MNLKSDFSGCVPIKVGYIAKTEELIVMFDRNIRRGYNAARFEGVDIDTLKQFQSAENKVEFFYKEIRPHFRYCATIYEIWEKFFKKKPSPIEVEEYKRKLKENDFLKSLDKEVDSE